MTPVELSISALFFKLTLHALPSTCLVHLWSCDGGQRARLVQGVHGDHGGQRTECLHCMTLPTGTCKVSDEYAPQRCAVGLPITVARTWPCMLLILHCMLLCR